MGAFGNERHALGPIVGTQGGVVMARRQWTMALWALRDLTRRPGETLLTAGVMVLLTVVIGTPLLISQQVSHMMAAVWTATPAMVVRRVDPTGWRPIPLSAAKKITLIPGAIKVRPRVWGKVPTASGSATVLAWTPDDSGTQPRLGIAAPAVGGVVVSPGGWPEGPIRLFGADGVAASFDIVGRTPAAIAWMSPELIIMNEDDARRLLGIPPDHATDITVDAFHETETEAISADVVRALPFPVHIDDKDSAIGRQHAAAAAANGSRTARFFPAIVAMALLVVVNLRQRYASSREIGLLKAVGWSASDIHRQHVFGALWVSAPAVSVGAAMSWAAVALPGGADISALLWGGPLPAGTSTAVWTSLGVVLLEVAMLVAIPYVAAVGLSSLIAATGAGDVRLSENGGRP